MTAVHATELVADYLRRLELELMNLAAEKRQEILDEIRGHIAEERTGIPNESDADIKNLLDRLGDPTEIAAAARNDVETQRPANATTHFGTLEVLALGLTLLAWPAGVVLLWVSRSWTTREKVLGTLVPPGGYPGVLLLLSTFHNVVWMSETAPRWAQVTVGAALFTASLLLVVAPLGMCIYLATRLRAASRSGA
jgi:hypothetical protein